MEVNGGMMAVVRGLEDSALCVTLLDGARQYTLLPNSAVPTVSQPAKYIRPTPKNEMVYNRDQDRGRCESSAQAVDGRYASIYKMSHCNMAPTSPPVELTEFPPQRAELCPGQGNFVVGGQGSGENYSPGKTQNSYRGGMSWPDRGAVCSPRGSNSQDPFARSLRQYPSMSPERSVEIVERLVNYSQMKNSRTFKSSTRDCSTQKQEKYSHCSRRNGSEPYRCCLHDHSPARERQKTEECGEYGRNYDVGYAKEGTRVGESTRNATSPFSQPTYPTIVERFDHLPSDYHVPELVSTNSVNIETQAEISMVSKEVTTIPRAQPTVRNLPWTQADDRRTGSRPMTMEAAKPPKHQDIHAINSVAIPLSPSSSNSDSKSEARNHTKYVQTTEALDLALKIRKSVQTCFSSVDLQESKRVENKRKSRSQEELRVKDVDEELVKLIHNLTSRHDLERENTIRSKLLKKLRKLQRIESEPVKIKIGRCIKDSLYSEIDLKNFTRELSNELISKIKRHNILIANNPTNVFRANTFSYKGNHEEKCIDDVIKEWLTDIPIKSLDYFGRDIKKGLLFHNIANKIRTVIMNKPKHNNDSTMKADLIEIIEDMPIDVSGHNKRFYINRLVTDLVRKIKDIFPINQRRRIRNDLEYPRQYFRLTEKEIKLFVRQEINEFKGKFNLRIGPETFRRMETGLTNALMDSIDVMRLGVNIDDVKEDLLVTLADFVSISEQQAIYFANNMIYNLKDIFDRNSVSKPRSQTFVVLQNSIQSQYGTNNTENSIAGITQADIDNNLEFYTNQVAEQITEWSNNIKGFQEIESGIRQVVITDLAGDIVDRHKYLELNPSSKKTDGDELEHLKYQIFKWINKVTGEYNMDTIARAAELMERIQRLPVPMLIMPQHNSKTIPSCCQNANVTVPNIKTEAVQSTSKDRRHSSPVNYRYKPESIEPNKTIVSTEDQNKQHKQDATTGDDCCQPHDVTTESKFNASVGVTSTPKNVANVDVDTVQNQMQNLAGPSVSMIEQSNRAPEAKRRMSVPAEFSPLRKRTSTEYSSGYGSHRRLDKNNCCSNIDCKAVLPNESPPIKRLNDEYDAFVRDWVQKIPINTTSPEEKDLAEKARLGIYNGIWKAITKLKMNPATMNNPFYYQDVFDDEIEELLNVLPQTPELVNKKHAMKAQLIEKTTEMNERLVAAVGPSTYKQQLVENVSNNLPGSKTGDRVRDEVKQFEELLKMNLVDNFILYTKFKSYDKVKANVFKKKVMKEVNELINSVKANHGKELKDIDTAAYVAEVINALQKVPLPSEDTIRVESDEINIGLEIDQWFSDLPILPSKNKIEDMERRRHKDTLAKKLHDIERESPLDEWKNLIKEEVRRFLGRILLKEETKNIDFMIEELANRLRNRPTDIIALGGDRKKSVTFVDAYEYNDFSKDMPACSSFSDDGRPAQADQSSYMIVDGTRARDPYGHNQDSEPQEWFSLEESANMNPTDGVDTAPSCCQTQQHPSNQTTSSQTPNSLRIRETPQNSGTEISNGNSRQQSEGFQNSRLDLNPQRDQGTQYLEAPDGGTVEGRRGSYTRPRTYSSSKSRRSSAPPSYRTEPISTQTRDFTLNQKSHSPKTIIPSHLCNPGNTSECKKTKEDRSHRKLDLEDTEYESEEEVRCRCIEKMWRCRKRSFFPCDNDYLPCYLRYPPHHCFF